MPAKPPPKRNVTVGVWTGQGPPPGYLHTVLILRYAFEDAMHYLDGDQYEYIASQVKELATHQNPTVSDTLSIDKVESFYELRESGSGGLGPGVNARVYFDLRPKQVIRILGFDVKKNNGKILEIVKDRILRRQQNWDNGCYPMISVTPPAGRSVE